MPILKRILAGIAGIISAFVVVFLMEMLSAKLYPFPNNLDVNNPEQIAAYIDSLPPTASLLVMAGYALASLAGGVVATLISGRERARIAIIIGLLLTVVGLFNPDPIWFKVTSSFIYVPFAYLGYLMVRKAES